MMKYLIVSDIHSNYIALTAILEKALERFGYTDIICLGDIVGYGAQPNECADKIFSLTDKIVLGNHDAGVIGRTDIRMFNYSAKEAINWTRDNLKKEHLKHFTKLKYGFTQSNAHFVHSSPSNPEYWNYINSIYEAQDEFGEVKHDIVFVGHTHIPLIYKMKGAEVKMQTPDSLTFEKGMRFIVNAGSVGQPRNNDARACALFYDEEKSYIEYLRVEYDVKSAQKLIIEAHLPHFLAERLERGL